MFTTWDAKPLPRMSEHRDDITLLVGDPNTKQLKSSNSTWQWEIDIFGKMCFPIEHGVIFVCQRRVDSDRLPLVAHINWQTI